MVDASPMSLRMSVLEERLCVCRLPRIEDFDFTEDSFFSITRTADEVSIVCPESDAPEGAEVEGGWRAIKVEGTLDFALVGVLASITAPLAEAEVPVFAISTYDTDYVLVKEASLEKAISALKASGHTVGGQR